MPKVKVLVVDDEKEFATTLAERLNLRNFKATAAHSAEDALAFIHDKNVPDVILLDLMMPLMGGMETLAIIKDYDPTIEVIILSGHGTTDSGINSKKEGAFDYILKPVDINELTMKINKAMDKRWATHARGQADERDERK